MMEKIPNFLIISTDLSNLSENKGFFKSQFVLKGRNLHEYSSVPHV